MHGVDELVEHALLGGRKPKVGIVDLFGEEFGRETEVSEDVGGHVLCSLLRRASALSSRAFGGSNGTWLGSSSLTDPRGREALRIGSTRWSTKRLPSCSSQGGSAGATMHRAKV